MPFTVTIQPVNHQQSQEYRSNYTKALWDKLQQSNPYASVSDSGDWLVTTTGTVVHAIDIEQLRPRADALDTFVITQSERTILEQVIESSFITTWAWSIKEACFKCSLGGYEPGDYQITGFEGSYFDVEGPNHSFSVVISRSLIGYAICLAIPDSAIMKSDEPRSLSKHFARTV